MLRNCQATGHAAGGRAAGGCTWRGCVQVTAGFELKRAKAASTGVVFEADAERLVQCS
jgi:hypothetical protein